MRRIILAALILRSFGGLALAQPSPTAPPDLTAFQAVCTGVEWQGPLKRDPKGQLWGGINQGVLPKAWRRYQPLFYFKDTPAKWLTTPYYDRPSFIGFTPDNIRWFRDGQTLYRIGPKGALPSITLSGRGYLGLLDDPAECCEKISFIGRNVLFHPKGLFMTAGDHMRLRKPDGTWEKIPFPKKIADFGRKFNGRVMRDVLFADTDGVWLIRPTGSNMTSAGGVLLYVTPHGAKEVYRSKPGTCISGMFRVGKDRYFLMGTIVQKRSADGNTSWYAQESKSLLKVAPIPPQKTLTKEIVQGWLDDLESGTFQKRNAAQEKLEQLPASWTEQLKKATPKSAEAKARLEQIIAKISFSPFRVTPRASWEGVYRGNLIFIDRQQRHYIVCPNRKELLIDGGKTPHRISLPSETFRIDIEEPDGTLWGQDGETIYRIDPKKGTATPTWRLGSLSRWNSRLMQVGKDGVILLQVAGKNSSPKASLWIDTKHPNREAVIAAKPFLKDILSEDSLRSIDIPLVAGPDSTIWLSRRKGKTPRDRRGGIYSLTGQTLQQIGAGDIPLSSQGHIWPITSKQALVTPVTSSGDPNYMLLSPGKQDNFNRLDQFVEKHNELLLKTLPEKEGFSTPRETPDLLIRIGPALFMRQDYFKRINRGTTTIYGEGVYRLGAWQRKKEVEWNNQKGLFLVRLTGIDVKNGRVIGFGGDYKTLVAVSLLEPNAPIETLETQETPWAYNVTIRGPQYPFAGRCIATPQAWKRLKKCNDEGRRHTPEDWNGFRFWRNGRWVTLPFSAYKTKMYRLEDQLIAIGNGRVDFLFNNDCVQSITTQGNMGWAQMSMENPDTIWITDAVSMRRLVARRNKTAEGRPGDIIGWRQTHLFSTAQYGYFTRGPWFSGNFGYFESNGTLYQFLVDKLLKLPSHSNPPKSTKKGDSP